LRGRDVIDAGGNWDERGDKADLPSFDIRARKNGGFALNGPASQGRTASGHDDARICNHPAHALIAMLLEKDEKWTSRPVQN
jgi:hypothetical protein